MKAAKLNRNGEETDVLVFDIGDEVIEALTSFARRQGISAARFTAIGAFERLTLQYFDWEARDYAEIPVDEQVEVLMLSGDIALEEGEPKVHAHVVVGKRDGTAYGGHLKEGIVRPTLELVLDRSATELKKRHDPETGLMLIDLAASQAKLL